MIDPNVLKNTLANPTEDNLFSLKALHKASGGEKKNQPNLWLNLVDTRKYIDFLDGKNPWSGGKSNSYKTESGGLVGGGDTFVCRKLVYHYAMWISPEFNSMVIDVFDAMLHNKPEEAQRIVSIYQSHLHGGFFVL